MADIMNTSHRVIYSDSKNMEAVPSESVDLMVTSPPYPMIAMWDEMFVQQSSIVKDFFLGLHGAARTGIKQGASE